MSQVLQQQYDNVSNNDSKVEKVNFFTISKQLVYTTITGIILGSWIVASYQNDQLFFKEAISSSLIIFLLVFIKSKSSKIADKN